MSGDAYPTQRRVAAVRLGPHPGSGPVAVAEEVPVALVYNGVSHAVMLATPADLEDFALGFSLSEGILADRTELLDVERHDAEAGIELRLAIAARRFAGLKDRRRALAGRTGCGLCGVDSLDQAVRPAAPLPEMQPVALAAIARALGELPGRQPLNRATHSVHAAAWADRDGGIRLVREDVGRHNALDKLIGAMAYGGVNTTDGFAIVTSRCSVELAQKAATARVPLLAAISGPTGLALSYAEAAGLTVVACARSDELILFTHPGRVAVAGALAHG